MMKTMTIRNIPDAVALELSTRASEGRMSVNGYVVNLLANAVGVDDTRKKVRDLSEFCGVWSKADLDEFNRVTAETRVVEEGDWR